MLTTLTRLQSHIRSIGFAASVFRIPPHSRKTKGVKCFAFDALFCGRGDSATNKMLPHFFATPTLLSCSASLRLDMTPSFESHTKCPQGHFSLPQKITLLGYFFCGSGGIRTHDTFYRMTVFKTVAFNLSATLPIQKILSQQSEKAIIAQTGYYMLL